MGDMGISYISEHPFCIKRLKDLGYTVKYLTAKCDKYAPLYIIGTTIEDAVLVADFLLDDFCAEVEETGGLPKVGKVL